MRTADFEVILRNGAAAISALQCAVEEAPRAPLTGDLFIFVNQSTFNVSELYRRAGFDALPATPSMSGAQIQAAAAADSNYRVFCQDAWNEYWHDRELSGSEAVPLINGMRFYTIPPCYGSGVYPDDIEEQKPFDWQQIHARYLRRDYTCTPWGRALREILDIRGDLVDAKRIAEKALNAAPDKSIAEARHGGWRHGSADYCSKGQRARRGIISRGRPDHHR